MANRLLVWGGCDESEFPGGPNCSEYLNSGARLVYEKAGPLGEPPETRWEAMSTVDAPLGRKLHTAVWTGDAKLAEARDKMIVFTGLSGSGKSSLAFDTIYAEGQRRYVESLSSYVMRLAEEHVVPGWRLILQCAFSGML